ncbi:putative N-acetyltransferase YjdG [Halomicronema hongdechloris C2206]|uniref:N-acetyltransferase YjdG n=1 Tax=Halomicronema hongdechloris C2206 TaxID=1641165 RepID=A0A1Z3HIQ4_9CYAN|nr:GNAT family N-acetyltransferase [Halomicronema hongdechloris]ASC70185.1 putative N-acetyltransferase YjdG [Halomicronema hongdechloris C2206]
MSMLLVEPAAIQHLQALLLGPDALTHQFGLAIAPDINLSTTALAFSLRHLVEGKVWPRWWTHLFILNDSRLVIGYGGYKGNPDADGIVEIGYAIAPSYQRQGFATQAARILMERAFAAQVTCVQAHTLPQENPSTRVLRKLGMARVASLEHPEDGAIWRWERRDPLPLIRSAIPADAEAIHQLVMAVIIRDLHPELSSEGQQTLARIITPDSLRQRLQRGAKIWVAEEAENLVGVIEVTPQQHIKLFFVASHRRHRGIGRLLFEMVKHHTTGPITVNSSAYALPVYRRLGFLQHGPITSHHGITFYPLRYPR